MNNLEKLVLSSILQLNAMSSEDSNIIFGGQIPTENFEKYSSIGDQLILDLEIGGTKTAFVREDNCD